MKNKDTTMATMARLRAIVVFVSDQKIARFNSIKECSTALGVPSSRICEYAKSGRVYRKGYQFKYE